MSIFSYRNGVLLCVLCSTIFFGAGIALAHPWYGKYATLNKFDIGNLQSGYRLVDGYYLKVKEEGDTCSVYKVAYSGGNFDIESGVKINLDDNNQVTPKELDGEWRLTLIINHSELVKVENIDRTHNLVGVEAVEGCYLVWEEVLK